MPDHNARTSVSSETPQHTGSEDSGIASLVVIAQLSGVAVSAERLKHLSGLSRPIDGLPLVRLARQVALKARSTKSKISRIAQTPLPAITELQDDAFPYTHYGTVAGKLMSISQNAVKDDKLGLIYPARIQLSAHVIVADGKDIQLETGMSSSVEIKTEQRRIIEYLLTPLLKYQSEALRER